MLWVDKHRPKSLDKLTYHPETTARLNSLAAAPHSLPHLLFYGPPGAGKSKSCNFVVVCTYMYGLHVYKYELHEYEYCADKTV